MKCLDVGVRDWRTELDESCGPLPVHQLDAGMALVQQVAAAAFKEGRVAGLREAAAATVISAAMVVGRLNILADEAAAVLP